MEQRNGQKSVFDWDGLQFPEESFSGNNEPEQNWDFHYLIISDTEKQPVIATYLCKALWKDDMMAPPAVSQQIEEKEKRILII